MKRLVAIALALVASLSFAGQGMGPGPGTKAYSGGGGGSLEPALAQACVQGTGAGTATATFGSAIASSNLAVAQVETGDDGGTASSVTMTGWTAHSANPLNTSGTKLWVFYRTGSTSTAATAVASGSQTTTVLACAFNTTTGTPTWTVDGAQSTGSGSASTTAAISSPASTITTTETNALLIGAMWGDGCPHLPGTGYTAGPFGSNWASPQIEYQVVTSPGPYAVDGVNGGCGAQNYMIMGIAFKAN